ncbi:MAG: hypothetical protein IPK42_15195 [Betaproteobacteria bacterium]|nr:hypothetical protein [Betaproteobacteria bacterium]
MKTTTKLQDAEMITRMDGDTLVVALRANMPTENLEDFLTALHADDVEVKLSWRATGIHAVMTTVDGGRVIAEFKGSDRD